MKKQLLVITLFIASVLTVNAQCVINSSLTNAGFYPDSLTGIAGATVGVPYNDDIQFRIPQDTVLFGFPVAIDNAVIDSVGGLPTFFAPTANPVGPVLGNGNGCIRISGTAVSGQELGGPNSDGVYPLIIYYTMTATVPFIGQIPLPLTNNYYRLVISPTVGLNVLLNKQNTSICFPNPANENMAIEFVSAGAKSYSLEVFNYLGQSVAKQTGNTKEGVNKIDFKTSSLANGTYIYRLTAGSSSSSKTFSIEH
jgi:hypothetical protein